MKGIDTVFPVLLKNWFRSKSGVFFSILFPLMLLLIFGTVFGSASEGEYTLHVQNRDLRGGEPTNLSSSFVSALESVEALKIKTLSPDVDIQTYVEEHQSFTEYRILVIPEGFHRNTNKGSLYVGSGVTLRMIDLIEEKFGYWMGENQLEQMRGSENMLENMRSSLRGDNVVLRLWTSEGDQWAPVVRTIVASVMGHFNNQMIGATPVIEVEEDKLSKEALGAVDYYLPGFIAAFIMTNGIIGVTVTISEFRRNGVIKRLAATPLHKRSWIIGNLLHQTFLAIILTLVMIGVAWVVFGIHVVPGEYALPMIFLGATTFSTMGIVLGGVIKDVEAANSAGNAIGFPMMFLSGAFWPLEMLPDFMQLVAKALPLYYFHEGLRQIMIYGNPQDALGPFVLFGVLAAGFIVLAVKVTKWKEW